MQLLVFTPPIIIGAFVLTHRQASSRGRQDENAVVQPTVMFTDSPSGVSGLSTYDFFGIAGGGKAPSRCGNPNFRKIRLWCGTRIRMWNEGVDAQQRKHH
ncbi:hypothetical protein GQ44DRAFT_700562 [Phaeosphaeriaceae sp. PMI808]|nr:hypothetical protein GQ44DRAFT_700562 [Phaeosphaeriaceae sp. PMI808]